MKKVSSGKVCHARILQERPADHGDGWKRGPQQPQHHGKTVTAVTHKKWLNQVKPVRPWKTGFLDIYTCYTYIILYL